MPRISSHPLQKLDEHQEKHRKEYAQEQGEDGEEEEEEEDDEEGSDVMIVQRFKCLSLYKRDFIRRGENLYGQWKQEQRLRASRMELHLSERWALDELIEEQLSRFDAHYSRALGPCKPKDVAQLLMPKCRLPLEMAAFAWLGNWRPSAILALLYSFSRSALSSSTTTSSRSFLWDRRSERRLLQLIRETRIEEAVLDEEMAEIQATCVLYLPFSPVNVNKNFKSNLDCLHSEFKKIHRVITQAQKLRFKTLELVVKKLLNRTQAAKFLVAFAGIQDMVHDFAACQKRLKGPISVTIKPIGT